MFPNQTYETCEDCTRNNSERRWNCSSILYMLTCPFTFLHKVYKTFSQRNTVHSDVDVNEKPFRNKEMDQVPLIRTKSAISRADGSRRLNLSMKASRDYDYYHDEDDYDMQNYDTCENEEDNVSNCSNCKLMEYHKLQAVRNTSATSSETSFQRLHGMFNPTGEVTINRICHRNYASILADGHRASEYNLLAQPQPDKRRFSKYSKVTATTPIQ